MSKIVTATAAMRLADDGRLDLDAPVGEYVDHLRAPGRRQPTVRQLLDHTSGLGNPLPIRWAHPAAADPPDPEVLLRRLMHRRGAVLHPAGMTRTGYAFSPDADAATGYVRAPRVADPLLRRLLPAGVAAAAACPDRESPSTTGSAGSAARPPALVTGSSTSAQAPGSGT